MTSVVSVRSVVVSDCCASLQFKHSLDLHGEMGRYTLGLVGLALNHRARLEKQFLQNLANNYDSILNSCAKFMSYVVNETSKGKWRDKRKLIYCNDEDFSTQTYKYHPGLL